MAVDARVIETVIGCQKKVVRPFSYVCRWFFPVCIGFWFFGFRNFRKNPVQKICDLFLSEHAVSWIAWSEMTYFKWEIRWHWWLGQWHRDKRRSFEFHTKKQCLLLRSNFSEVAFWISPNRRRSVRQSKCAQSSRSIGSTALTSGDNRPITMSSLRGALIAEITASTVRPHSHHGAPTFDR